ncbi:MAG: amidohydrolase family protein [Blautia sp.]|nr:amidohydrolase family protein [Blautia sp.]
MADRTRTELIERIRILPVIDVHTHFETYTETFGYTMPQFFYYSSYLVCYSNWFPLEDRLLIEDRSADPVIQYKVLLKLIRRCRHTTTARFLDRMAELIGIPLEEESYERLMEWYGSRTIESIRAWTPTITQFIANSPGHPLYGGLKQMGSFLDGTRRADPEVLRSMTVNELHCIRDKHDLDILEQLSGISITSLGDWENASEKVLTRAMGMEQLAAFKDLYLYFRPMQIGKASREKAEQAFEAVQRGGKSTLELMDYMMFRVYGMLEEKGLPLQIHTGGLMDTAVTAQGLLDLAELIQSFPKLRFDLLHLNYPMLDFYETVLKSCENAYGDATWIFSSDPGYVMRYLDFALDVLPADRTILFGSDRHCAGVPVAAALDIAEAITADFLAERIVRGQLSWREAEEIAGLWLYGNPQELFGRRRNQ